MRRDNIYIDNKISRLRNDLDNFMQISAQKSTCESFLLNKHCYKIFTSVFWINLLSQRSLLNETRTLGKHSDITWRTIETFNFTFNATSSLFQSFSVRSLHTNLLTSGSNDLYIKWILITRKREREREEGGSQRLFKHDNMGTDDPLYARQGLTL